MTGGRSLSSTANSHYQLPVLETSGEPGQRQVLMTSQRKHLCCAGTLEAFERGGSLELRQT